MKKTNSCPVSSGTNTSGKAAPPVNYASVDLDRVGREDMGPEESAEDEELAEHVLEVNPDMNSMDSRG